MIKIVVQKNMDGAYYALAYDGEDILFKTNLFDTAAGARKEAAEKLKGECEAADEKGVQFCSSRETGKIYYLWDGERYEAYPNQAKGN